MNKEEFIKFCKSDLGIEITEKIYSKLKKYHEMLVEWNQKFNMTTILEEQEVLLKHFYDSLCLKKAIDLNTQSLCDVGTGAGFPGMVLKIVFSDLKITLVESNGKKCTFLKEVIKELELNDIEVINARAEDYALKNIEKFDIVTMRAVSDLRIIAELGLPMLKIGGIFSPLKAHIGNEIEKSQNIIKILGGKLEKVINYELPIEKSTRTIPIITKEKSSKDGFPRNYSRIVKQPI